MAVLRGHLDMMVTKAEADVMTPSPTWRWHSFVFRLSKVYEHFVFYCMHHSTTVLGESTSVPHTRDGTTIISSAYKKKILKKRTHSRSQLSSSQAIISP